MASITVTGMSCDHCRRSVTEAISKVPGVSAVTVDLSTGKASWQGDEAPATVEAVKAAVRHIGFEA